MFERLFLITDERRKKIHTYSYYHSDDTLCLFVHFIANNYYLHLCRLTTTMMLKNHYLSSGRPRAKEAKVPRNKSLLQYAYLHCGNHIYFAQHSMKTLCSNVQLWAETLSNREVICLISLRRQRLKRDHSPYHYYQ